MEGRENLTPEDRDSSDRPNVRRDDWAGEMVTGGVTDITSAEGLRHVTQPGSHSKFSGRLPSGRESINSGGCTFERKSER